MKKIKSRVLGEIEVDESTRLNFNGSILGFEEYNDFYILDNNSDKDSIFKILQSSENEDLSWIVLSPFVAFPDYELDVHDEDVKSLNIENEKDVIALVMVTIVNNDYENMTVNLLGPIIINLKNNLGKQCIIKSNKYTTKHKLLEHVAQ